jgi:hypothetical protein
MTGDAGGLDLTVVVSGPLAASDGLCSGYGKPGGVEA